MRRLAALSLLVVFALTGCASDEGAAPESTPAAEASATATTTPTPDPAGAGEDVGADPRGTTYGSIEEMRVDLEAAGVSCPTLVDRDQNPNTSETGWCENYAWLLSTFADTDARNVVLQLNVDSVEPGTYLVGPNWLLAAGDPAEPDEKALLGSVRPVLRGVVWDYTQPFPA